MNRRLWLSKFHARIEKTDGCWLWTGTRNDQAYGIVSYMGRKVRATHAALLVFRGALPPDGAVVCHTCDNPPCVNPDHLFTGTQAENIADMVAKGRHRPPPQPSTKARARGDRHGMSKLDGRAVLEIRQSKTRSGILAQRFGVHPSTIRRVRAGEAWAHVRVA